MSLELYAYLVLAYIGIILLGIGLGYLLARRLKNKYNITITRK